MHKSFITLLLAVCFISGLKAYATFPSAELRDSLLNDHKVIFFGEGANPEADSIRNLVENFYYDQFRSFQDPDAPYFLFMSRGADLAMGIGGLVRMRGYLDWDGSVNQPAFSPYFIPVSRDPLSRENLGTTPAGTALFFRVIGKNKRMGQYQLYIEANFNGYKGRDFHLKKAYATINDWTIGYAASTFGDGAAVPPTVDSNGPTMKMDNTSVLVRYMHSIRQKGDKAVVIAASLETPQMTLQPSEYTAARNQFLPNIAAMLQYEWSRDDHVRLSGIMRFLPYRDLVTERSHQAFGYGVQLSTVFRIVPALKFYGTFNTGKSYSNYGGDFLLGQYDMVTDGDHPGELKRVPGFGYFLGLQYNFRPNLFMSATFGQGRYLPTQDPIGTDYKYGLYSAANIFWNLTPRIMVGAEINVGKRQDFNGEHGWARRVGALASFSF
ncbi:MAG: hypothetical protein NC221_02510 [Duncaniella sp.]|nr:hypothetical protein [Muribaculum sp.]MCM1254972.1 hypothetical protein [Duncaniella sp.]